MSRKTEKVQNLHVYKLFVCTFEIFWNQRNKNVQQRLDAFPKRFLKKYLRTSDAKCLKFDNKKSKTYENFWAIFIFSVIFQLRLGIFRA